MNRSGMLAVFCCLIMSIMLCPTRSNAMSMQAFASNYANNREALESSGPEQQQQQLVQASASRTQGADVYQFGPAGRTSMHATHRNQVPPVPPTWAAYSTGPIGAPLAGLDTGASQTRQANNNADRIRVALRRFIGGYPTPNQAKMMIQQQQQQQQQLQQSQADGGEPDGVVRYEPEARIQTRSAPQLSGPEQEMSPSWYEAASALDNGDDAQAVETRAKSVKSDTQFDGLSAQASQSPSDGSSGHKTIRNSQAVFMRLPPRFGKRNSNLYGR